MKDKAILGVLVAVVLVGLWWLGSNREEPEPTERGRNRVNACEVHDFCE